MPSRLILVFTNTKIKNKQKYNCARCLAVWVKRLVTQAKERTGRSVRQGADEDMWVKIGGNSRRMG
jgi:hypothetical protein